MLDWVLAESVHIGLTRVLDAQLAPISETAFTGIDCSWEFQCSLPQWHTEEILRDRLTELGGSVERGLTATSVRSADASVLVQVEHADGAAETIEAAWVIGAGGAHSVTRESMGGVLGGENYPGLALAADVQVTGELPRDASALIVSPAGYVLLAPLPDNRWITFVGDLADDEAALLRQDRSVPAIAASIRRRVPDALLLTDVTWASPFQMQRRIVAKLADRRRFLIGDAGHLSSPFGGEGLNSGLHDADNLGWKLALELQGRARPGLVASFAAERLAADRQILATSDRLHSLAHCAVDLARTGVAAPPLTSAQKVALTRSRTMLDVSYAGSPLCGAHEPGVTGPVPGERYPGRVALTGLAHQLLLTGEVDPSTVRRLADRWKGLVDISRAPAAPRSPGVLLVRPDGHVGFASARADVPALAALDAHLDSYLLPA